MRVDRLIPALFVLALAASAPLAQTRPAASPAATTAPAQANVPPSKVALINTEVFADEKQGIFRIVAAVKRVDTEFEVRKKELQTLQTQLQQLNDEVEKTKNVAALAETQKKLDRIEQLKKDGTRKQEDAQAAYNKRMQEALAPIYEDIGKSLDAFGKAQGITLLLDASKIAPAILSAADASDVTKAFIAEFNSKFPATAAVTPPK